MQEKQGLIIDPADPVWVHTTYQVLVTSYPWSRVGRNVPWARRYPAYQNGLIDRATQAYGEYVAPLCFNNRVSFLSGFFQPGQPPNVVNPITNFDNSLWKATNLGTLRLVHMAGLYGFPGTRAEIKTQVSGWLTKMQSAKYGRIRDRSGASRPLLIFWGNEFTNDPLQFVQMVQDIRTALQPAGNPFIIGTEHFADYVAMGKPNALAALQALDGVYNHACALPWDTCGGCDRSNVEWYGSDSAKQLNTSLSNRAHTTAVNGRLFIGGTMPRFDRDLHCKVFDNDINCSALYAKQGRVVTIPTSTDPASPYSASGPTQVRNLLKIARNYAGLTHTETRLENGVQHIYDEKLVILTSWNEWEEGTTFEPSTVRSTAYTGINCDYGDDALKAIAEVFAPTVVRER